MDAKEVSGVILRHDSEQFRRRNSFKLGDCNNPVNRIRVEWSFYTNEHIYALNNLENVIMNFI
jgi:hypothetical protein